MKYFIIAGEASGDLHASNLMKGLYAEDPGAEISFWGGEKMAATGGTLLHHYKEGAVMGLGDVLAKAGKLLGNLARCKKDILEFNPDVVILVDYPGFNFKIAKFAHAKGYKVFYYIAPKTWASREGRNRKLKKYVNKLFIVFPFEIPYFTSRHIPFEYVGNPLLDAIDDFSYRPIGKNRYIAVLAGSRKGEISRTMPVAMSLIDSLKGDSRYQGYRFIVAGAPSRDISDYEEFITGRNNVEIVFDRTYDILKEADAAIINSGTASLEAALIGTPQIVGWSSTPITFFVATKLFHVLDRIKFISLGNLIADRLIFKELLQNDFTPEKVKAELDRILFDSVYRQKMAAGYGEIRAALGGSGASRAVARAILTNLQPR